ncbi:MAG: PrsW family glutamic-type intramembrane protease [Jiangellaceae bacterium]
MALSVAACYGVFQLAVLGSATRTVGGGTLLLAVGVGLYFCGPAAVALQLAYTRSVAALSDAQLGHVVEVAGYTLDPFIEEAVKVAPLLLVGLHVRTRLQWGLTDYLLLGAAAGAGFGLLEALMRFGRRAGAALEVPGGWIFPSLSPPYVPDFGATLGSWLPQPISSSDLFLPSGPDTFHHLVWSAAAGLGVGWLLRERGPARFVGVIPVLLVGGDHAAYNFNISLLAYSTFGDVLAAPFVAAEPLRWLWPVLALGVAVWFDLRTLRPGKAEHVHLLLGDRHSADLAALARYAAIRPPWTTFIAWR